MFWVGNDKGMGGVGILSQIDYILVKWQNIKLVRDVKVIPNEECENAKIVKSEDWCKNLY